MPVVSGVHGNLNVEQKKSFVASDLKDPQDQFKQIIYLQELIQVLEEGNKHNSPDAHQATAYKDKLKTIRLNLFPYYVSKLGKRLEFEIKDIKEITEENKDDDITEDEEDFLKKLNEELRYSRKIAAQKYHEEWVLKAEEIKYQKSLKKVLSDLVEKLNAEEIKYQKALKKVLSDLQATQEDEEDEDEKEFLEKCINASRQKKPHKRHKDRFSQLNGEPVKPKTKTPKTKKIYKLGGLYNTFRLTFNRIRSLFTTTIRYLFAANKTTQDLDAPGRFNAVNRGYGLFIAPILSLGYLIQFFSDVVISIKTAITSKKAKGGRKLSFGRRLLNALKKDGRAWRMANDGVWGAINLIGVLFGIPRIIAKIGSPVLKVPFLAIKTIVMSAPVIGNVITVVGMIFDLVMDFAQGILERLSILRMQKKLRPLDEHGRALKTKRIVKLKLKKIPAERLGELEAFYENKRMLYRSTIHRALSITMTAVILVASSVTMFVLPLLPVLIATAVVLGSGSVVGLARRFFLNKLINKLADKIFYKIYPQAKAVKKQIAENSKQYTTEKCIKTLSKSATPAKKEAVAATPAKKEAGAATLPMPRAPKAAVSVPATAPVAALAARKSVSPPSPVLPARSSRSPSPEIVRRLSSLRSSGTYSDHLDDHEVNAGVSSRNSMAGTLFVSRTSTPDAAAASVATTTGPAYAAFKEELAATADAKNKSLEASATAASASNRSGTNSLRFIGTPPDASLEPLQAAASFGSLDGLSAAATPVAAY